MRDLASGNLRSHSLDGVCRRADEDEPRLLAGTRERGVLRQEAVAGMNGLGARLAGGSQDRLDGQITCGRGRGPDPNGVVGQDACSACASASE